MLKIGILGCGYMGEMHYNCYKNIEGVKVTAIACAKREEADKLCPPSDTEIYTDAAELIEKADVDAIDICLPTFLHTKFGKMAMEKVKYVFIEKPVALTLDEGRELSAKAKETGCQVQVGQVIRFWDEYVALSKIVEEKKYGEIVNADFYRLSPRPLWGQNNWMTNSKLSGGAAQDLHIHDIDYILSVFGKPEKVFSVKNTLEENNSYISTLLQYKTFPVTVEGSWNLPVSFPFSAGFRIRFMNAAVEYKDGKVTCYDDNGSSEIKIEKETLAGNVTSGNISDLGGYYNELVYFTSRAKAGKPIEKAKLSDAVDSLAFLLDELKIADESQAF